MISWEWLIPAAMLGGTVGFLVLAVIVGGSRGDR